MADTASRPRTSWPATAKRTFREVTEAHPALEKSTLSALYGACDLISEADEMQRVIDADGRTVSGSMGQTVAHPQLLPSLPGPVYTHPVAYTQCSARPRNCL